MYKQLTSAQRSEIYAYNKSGMSAAFIANEIGVHQSTIYRELSRNSNKHGVYTRGAHEMALERRERIPSNAIPQDVKAECLRLLREFQWSPEQISGHMNRRGIKVSHTTIYNWVKQDRKAGGTLYKNLRNRGKKLREGGYKGASAKNIPDRTPISERPAEADGTRFGDWEMDLIIGKNGYQAILVLVERLTGYAILYRLPHGRKSKDLAKAVVTLLIAYRVCVLTITTDNGSEFAAHKRITKGLGGATVYFTDPYSSWQKGLVEYTNKLVRQYIPKGADFEKISARQLMDIQKKLNSRPRKKLNFSTPKIEFFKHFS